MKRSMLHSANRDHPDRHPRHPIANAEPMGTAIAVVRIASQRLCSSALRVEESNRIDSCAAGSPTHQRRLNPSQCVIELPALNEKTIAASWGPTEDRHALPDEPG